MTPCARLADLGRLSPTSSTARVIDRRGRPGPGTDPANPDPAPVGDLVREPTGARPSRPRRGCPKVCTRCGSRSGCFAVGAGHRSFLIGGRHGPAAGRAWPGWRTPSGRYGDSEVRRERLDLLHRRPRRRAGREVDWEADRVRSARPLVEEHERALASSSTSTQERAARPGPARPASWIWRPPSVDGTGHHASRARTCAAPGRLLPRARQLPDGGGARPCPHARGASPGPARCPPGHQAPATSSPSGPSTANSPPSLHHAPEDAADRPRRGAPGLTVVTRVYLHALVQDTHPPLDPAAALTPPALIERESRAAEERRPPGRGRGSVAGSPRLGEPAPLRRITRPGPGERGCRPRGPRERRCTGDPPPPGRGRPATG